MIPGVRGMPGRGHSKCKSPKVGTSLHDPEKNWRLTSQSSGEVTSVGGEVPGLWGQILQSLLGHFKLWFCFAVKCQSGYRLTHSTRT